MITFSHQNLYKKKSTFSHQIFISFSHWNDDVFAFILFLSCTIFSVSKKLVSLFFIVRCSKLQDRKDALLHYWRSVTKKHPQVSALVENIIESNDEELFLQLVLDCESVPEVSEAAKNDATVLPLLHKITNIWAYSLFRARLKIQGRWTFLPTDLSQWSRSWFLGNWLLMSVLPVIIPTI